MRFPSILHRFKDSRRGATAVEFGLLALPFFAVICAIFELAYVDFESDMLQAAIVKATRQMTTGQLQTNGIATAAAFKSTYLCPTTGTRILPSNFDCTKMIIDVRTATSFAAGDMSNSFYKSTTNEFCPGAAGTIVVLRVAYPLGAIFPLSLFSPHVGLANDVPGLTGWYHILVGRSLFEVESFTTSYTAPSGC